MNGRKKGILIGICLILGIFSLSLGSRIIHKNKEPKVAFQTQDEPITLKWAIEQQVAYDQEIEELLELAKDKGVNVEPWIIPLRKDGEADYLLISLLSGEPIDICYDSYANMKNKINGKVVYPLNELGKHMNYDFYAEYGENLPVFNEKVYGLPAFVDIAVTLYNKKIFDDAGIPYPDADQWTWESYIQVAEKLTDASQGIYGSFMPTDWAHYNYFYAIQKGTQHYKPDGTSNYDAPEFIEALKFNYDFGNTYKVQPDILTMKSRVLPYDSFTQGNYGMYVCGGWVMKLMKDRDKYPRDWEFGLLPMPYPEGYEKSTMTVTGIYWIPTTSKYKDLAFETIRLFAENQYKLGYGKIPARKSLSQEELKAYAGDLAELFHEDHILKEDFWEAWFDPNMILYPEKVVGPGDVAINQAFIEEGTHYALGEITLEEALSNIKRKADKAILEDMNP